MKRRNFLKGLMIVPAVAVVGCKALSLPSVMSNDAPSLDTIDAIIKAQAALDAHDVPAKGRILHLSPEIAEIWSDKLLDQFYGNTYFGTGLV